jgi:hypothetical protein
MIDKMVTGYGAELQRKSLTTDPAAVIQCKLLVMALNFSACNWSLITDH